MHFSSLAAAAAVAATAEAALVGFNYGSTLSDGSAKTQADFEAEFLRAQDLQGTNGEFTSARLYTMIQSGTTDTPIYAIPAAIDTQTSLLLGLWASAGQTDFTDEITALTSAITEYGTDFTSLIVGISVGSEDLYRNTVTGEESDAGAGANPDTLVDYIKQVKAAIADTDASSATIGHVDTWTAWVNSSNSAVIEACDWIGMDAYPYFQNTEANGIDVANATFWDAYEETVAVADGKDVWVSETGWPVSGETENDAVASTANAEIYWQQTGCSLFNNINTFWYILQDALPTVPSPSFGIVGSDLASDPLYNLTCSNGALGSSSTSSSASSSATSSAVTTVSSVTAPASATGTNTESVSDAAPAAESSVSVSETSAASSAKSTASSAASAAASAASSAASSVASQTSAASAAASAASSATSEGESAAAATSTVVTSSVVVSGAVTHTAYSTTLVTITSCSEGCTTSETSVAAASVASAAASSESAAAPTSTAAVSSASVGTAAPSPATSSATTAAAASTSASSTSCPADLDGEYQYPHLIIPVNKDEPETAYGTQYNGTFTPTVSTIFNFDIPADYAGKTCSLVFLFPEQDELETSAFTFNGEGGISVNELASPATEETTYDTVPSVSVSAIGTIASAAPGNSYVLASYSCDADTTQAFEFVSTGGLELEYFEDYNPSPIGAYITVC